MTRDKIIDVIAFGKEIGRQDYDIDQGKSNVYFNPKVALSSAKDLYRVMEHELVHVSQISQLACQTNTFINSVRGIMEFQAYNYQSFNGAGTMGNSFSAGEIRRFMTNFPSWFEKLSFMNYAWTKNYNYQYPF